MDYGKTAYGKNTEKFTDKEKMQKIKNNVPNKNLITLTPEALTIEKEFNSKVQSASC